jgi:cell division septum initiation protein DivIVA
MRKPDADQDREAEEQSHQRLEEIQREADRTLEEAAEKLREVTEQQEAHAERLRKEAREPRGPVFPAGLGEDRAKPSS